MSLKKWEEAGLLDREIILYKKLIENDVKVVFITYGDESDYQYRDTLENIEIIPFYAFIKKPSSKIIRFIQSFFLPFILKDKLEKANIFKTNQMSMTWAPLLAKLLFKKKLILRCGFEWYRFLLKNSPSFLVKSYVYLTEWLSYNMVDGIILTSEDDKKYIIEKFHLKDSKKIRIISNYIDIDFFKPSETTQKKKNHIIFVGRLAKQKNLLNLFDAIKESKYILDIIGDGELKEELKDYSLKNQINVNFLGRVPNNKIPEILNQYEVFVLPSYYEGNPKALLEAMSCGLAVIGTEVDGIRNIIKHKENGYLCETDSKSIRDAIDVVMEDKFVRQSIGVQAREFVVSHCSIDEILKRESEFYSTGIKF